MGIADSHEAGQRVFHLSTGVDDRASRVGGHQDDGGELAASAALQVLQDAEGEVEVTGVGSIARCFFIEVCGGHSPRYRLQADPGDHIRQRDAFLQRGLSGVGPRIACVVGEFLGHGRLPGAAQHEAAQHNEDEYSQRCVSHRAQCGGMEPAGLYRGWFICGAWIASERWNSLMDRRRSLNAI